MAASFKITTTGTLTPISFPDIGSRDFVHPIVSLDMIADEGYELEELLSSQDIRDAISNGHITVEDAEGNPITDPDDLPSAAQPHDLGSHEDVTLTGLSDNDIIRYDLASDEWKSEAAPPAPVDSVFSRTGAVVATSGDYDSSEVDYTPSTLGDWDSSSDPGQNDDALDQLAARTKLNDAKVSADGSIDTHSDVDTTTSAPTVGQVLEWNGSDWIPVTPSAGVFGTEFSSSENNAEDATTSTTFVETLTLTTASIPSGDYYIEWYVEYSTATNGNCLVQIQLDDTTTLGSVEERSQSQSAFETIAGFAIVTLTAAIHDIDMDFASSNGSKTATVRRRRLRIHRVN